MDNVTARVDGLDDLMKAFGNIGTITADKEVEAALEQESKDLRNEIRARAPRGATGNLQRGVVGKLLKRRNRRSRSALTAIDFRIAQHAHLVEYGHGGSSPAPAHPFFRPAVRAFQFGRRLTPVARKRLEQLWGK